MPVYITLTQDDLLQICRQLDSPSRLVPEVSIL